MRGIYNISASYAHHVDKDMDITFEVVSEKLKDNTILKTSPNDVESFESNKDIFEEKIPVWFKNTAKGWANGQFSDTIIISGIQHLIENDIIELSDDSETLSQNSKEIPQWVKNIAGFWTSNMITDDDFISSIEYLVNNQIINP